MNKMRHNSFEKAKSKNKNLEIRGASREDASIFVDLNNKQYLRKKDRNYFYWMFINNFFPTKLVTAYDKNIPVAFYGIQIHKLSDGRHCGLSVDIIIEEKYRNRGLFVLLENEAFKFASSNEAEIMTVFGNYHGMRAHEKLETWKTIAKIDTLIFDCKNGLNMNNYKVVNGKNDLTFYLKDQIYRKWRFDTNPVYKYDKINLSKDVFSFTKIFEDPQNKTRYGDIVDFKCELNNFTLLRELFAMSCEHLIGEKVNFITAWALPHTTLCNILISMGFKPFPQERYFCVRILKPDYECLNDINNWHLVESDSEVY